MVLSLEGTVHPLWSTFGNTEMRNPLIPAISQLSANGSNPMFFAHSAVTLLQAHPFPWTHKNAESKQQAWTEKHAADAAIGPFYFLF